jgi:amino acid adenylation domain-containing protein
MGRHVTDSLESRPAARGRRAQPIELSEETSRRLQDLEGFEGALPAVSTCAVAILLVARYTYWDNIVLGVSAGTDRTREAPDDAGVVPLSVSVADDPVFVDLWHRVRDAIPASRLAEVARPGDNGIDLHLQLRSQPRLLIAPAVDASTDEPGDTRLVLSCRLVEGRIVGTLQYDATVFDEGSADRLSRHFVRAATAVAATPGVHVSAVDILDTRERTTLLENWNASRRGYPDGTAHGLFLRQVRKTPAAVALIEGERTLSYEDLNTRVNRLAWHLRARGVGLETPVGVSLDRSADAVIAVLAILKAGGMFVPLDPAFPRPRLDEMIRDADISIVVTRGPFRAGIPIEDAGVVSLDRDLDVIARERGDEPPAVGCQDNAAYLLYTSGSTGRPKAIVGIHKSIVCGACDVPFRAEDVDDVCSLNSSLSFGFTLARLFLPLFYGHRLVIVPDGEEKDLVSLVRAWERAGVGNIAMVTPLLRQLLESGDDLIARLHRVRTVAVGGSMIVPSTIAAFFRAMPNATLMNGYASTEVGTAALIRVLTRDAAAQPSSVGVPFANTAVYILDRHLQLMPPGAVGELCLAAPHMARAYLRRPGLTAERFVPNPFMPGARLMRTGDLARHLANGEVEILGRTDDQVKIRGFRIELAEVESRLAEHADVRFAATAAREINGEKRLVAYVGRAHESLSASMLRAYLAQRLPEYMVPAVFMFVESLPLTAVGKVDRAALPAPVLDQGAEDAYVAPRNAIETELAALWSAVLGVERVGVQDHFLDLGGDSLYAMEIVAQVKDTFGVDVSTVQLISECATIAALAARIAVAQLSTEALA